MGQGPPDRSLDFTFRRAEQRCLRHQRMGMPVTDPCSTAALAVRSQIWRAICGVSRASAGWPIKRSVACTRSSDTRLRNGDCSSCTARPWRSVAWKTASPVLFSTSASTSVAAAQAFLAAIVTSSEDVSALPAAPARRRDRVAWRGGFDSNILGHRVAPGTTAGSPQHFMPVTSLGAGAQQPVRF